MPSQEALVSRTFSCRQSRITLFLGNLWSIASIAILTTRTWPELEREKMDLDLGGGTTDFHWSPYRLLSSVEATRSETRWGTIEDVFTGKTMSRKSGVTVASIKYTPCRWSYPIRTATERDRGDIWRLQVLAPVTVSALPPQPPQCR
jgi:hypothetical protein